jgi:YebC/PmpR family DNA-binding regulatory protein
MSGHSHAKTVKHQKELTDKKRGQIFSKMAKIISVAAKEGGPNPETNYKLKIAIETAHSQFMPNENIERSIKRGTGELDEGVKLEEFSLEAYGPKGIAMIIIGITDNKNRTLGEVKQILGQFNGKLASEGSVKWLFERKGFLTIDSKDQPSSSKEDLELIAIEAGADDVVWQEDILEIYTKPEDLEKTRKALDEKGIKAGSASLDWVAKEEIALSESEAESCQKLFDSLDENDSVQEVYSNLKA